MPNVVLQAPAGSSGIVFAGGTSYAIDPVTRRVTVPAENAMELIEAGYNIGSQLDPNYLPTQDGLSMIGVARATWDFSIAANQTTGAKASLTAIIPNLGIICGGFMQVKAAITSTNSTAQVAISANAANDIQTAAAVSGAPWSTTGKKAIVPKANTPESTSISCTADRALTATVSVEAITGGMLLVVVYYVMGL